MSADIPFDIERATALEGMPHGFFGAGPQGHQFGYGGPGDASAIGALRAAAASFLVTGARLVTPHQTHSTIVLTIAEAWADEPQGRPEADALVTRESGLAIGIVTADCAPVLFSDHAARVIGAAHAGWRGAQGGICENTIAAMEALGARRERVAAAIGPTIAQDSYEVDAPFRAHFTQADEPHFAPAPMREEQERWHFDLPGYIFARLQSAGLCTISNCAHDTFSLTQRYHSYRRAANSGAPTYGRQISLIALD